ncbi:hypothetical protein, unlikely [Trypanosoma brucei gambiense DAL972]|uniref:Uncharacterized protein n=1 Tax=Trypanosoma brucei gambiense (strain MHOM/CI/86/DAL972) TaxID=679716 RepID=C9ZWT7_TRYB9|nr:hypothetical protein, unlikely [Trypanosoma brucei gambiense DAL972]CBH13876.1 hypothetical protein, unlikely [Trypanosoma brucei gambiense DAL972]|eukprot:XP_011776152.1 hypothetical protein, unlikely [Trypanosoma brucei gambiense DAL972]
MQKKRKEKRGVQMEGESNSTPTHHSVPRFIHSLYFIFPTTTPHEIKQNETIHHHILLFDPFPFFFCFFIRMMLFCFFLFLEKLKKLIRLSPSSHVTPPPRLFSLFYFPPLIFFLFYKTHKHMRAPTRACKKKKKYMSTSTTFFKKKKEKRA